MTEQPEPVGEPIDHHTPIRASFSMDRGSRDAIRKVAERYGVDQSDVVNLAPALFVILAEATLNKRRSRLAQLETAARQAAANIAAIEGLAPHLGIFAEALAQILNAVLEAERISIEQCHVIHVTENLTDNDPNKIMDRAIYAIEDLTLKMAMASPLSEAIKEMAKFAGIVINQDTEGENGTSQYPFSMIFKLGDGSSGNMAVAAHRQYCQIVPAASMDEMLSARTEEGYQPNWLTGFTTLLA